MNLKRLKFISTLCIFILCFLTHFLYSWFPNGLFAILFPVNESIWEHMKMIYTTTLLFGIIEYIIINKYKLTTNNFLINLFFTGVSCIIIYLLIYLPIYYKIGSKTFLNISILFISIGLSQIVSYYLYKLKNIKYNNIIGIFLIILGICIMGYLTYNPIKNELFFDKMDEKYGINIYLIN